MTSNTRPAELLTNRRLSRPELTRSARTQFGDGRSIVIDDDELARGLRRLEPQPKLLLERREDRLSPRNGSGVIGR